MFDIRPLRKQKHILSIKPSQPAMFDLGAAGWKTGPEWKWHLFILNMRDDLISKIKLVYTGNSLFIIIFFCVMVIISFKAVQFLGVCKFQIWTWLDQIQLGKKQPGNWCCSTWLITTLYYKQCCYNCSGRNSIWFTGPLDFYQTSKVQSCNSGCRSIPACVN